MTANELPSALAIVIGVLGLVKGLSGIIAPAALQKFARWWAGAVRQVNTLTGWLCIAIAVALWVVVLIDQPVSNWIILAFGALVAWAGSVYLKREEFEKLMKRFVLDRKPWFIRAVSVGIVVVSILMIWVGIKKI